MNKEKLNELLEELKAVLNENPVFHYAGRGANDGVWQTFPRLGNEGEGFVDITRHFGFVYMAAFRIMLWRNQLDGVVCLVEMYANSCYEWESVFNGYVDSPAFLRSLLYQSIGIPNKKKHEIQKPKK